MSDSNDAVWKKPAWITAMVGLVSAFLTLPDVIGNYLEKRQDIELAKVAIGTVQIQNSDIKQDQEFKIVNNTLALQGTERVFVLRYLAATLDDDDAKSWANAEVTRLENLATEQEKLAEQEQELKKIEEELQARSDKTDAESKRLQDEIGTLQKTLNRKNSEITQLRQTAGIADRNDIRSSFFIVVTLDWSADNTRDVAVILSEGSFGGASFPCRRTQKHCQKAWTGDEPDSITIKYGAVFSSLFVAYLEPDTINSSYIRSVVIPYTCAADEQEVVCVLERAQL